ncbi:MAG: hypothetical protein GY850_46465 [bacterium]|nr:hypothetical protein [bacterium]
MYPTAKLPAADKQIYSALIVLMASGELPEVIELSGDDETKSPEEPLEDKKTDIKQFAPLIRKAFRVLLAVFLFIIVLRLWGIKKMKIWKRVAPAVPAA